MAIANYFYNETTRRYVALFGTLFNQIKIERNDNAGNSVQSMIVPLSYAPFQKVLSRLNEDPDLLNSRRSAISLPRMSFEITSFQYDPARKIGSTQKLRKAEKAETDASRNFVYASVPYNLDFSLYIMTKYSEDATKIMEQILPFFTPDWTVTAQMVPDLDAIDIPIILNSVTTDDLYEGDYETRQSILYTLNFTLKGWYFGPEKKRKVIKFIDVGFATGTLANTPPEEALRIKPGLDINGNPLYEDGIAATATATVSNGVVSSIDIVNDGENYNPNNNILVTVSDPDSIDATITPVIANTSIVSMTIDEAGGYYSTIPSITITPPNLPVTTATASAVLTGDTVTSIGVTNGGTYYNTATVSIPAPPAKSQYIKFGDDALYHENHTDKLLSHVTDYSLVTAGSGFAIEFWIYPEEFNASKSHILHYDGTTMRIEIEANGELAYRPVLNSPPVRSTPEALVLNQWNHCRIEHYGSTAKWLINGTVDAGGSAPQGFLLGGGTNVYIGERSVNERSFLGALDNLTITQISSLTADGSYTVPAAPQTGSYFTDDFDKIPATATATVVDGEVTEIVVTNPGKNYTSTPDVTISDPDGSSVDYQATASAALTDGAVSLITINNPGKFYSSANAAIDSVTSSTATASIEIDGTGQAATITITSPGSGYRTAPTVTIGNPAATSIPYQQIEFDDDWGIITVIEDV
jgi:hypothetical protein